eukprot:4723909-Amphidinium_carterae.1
MVNGPPDSLRSWLGLDPSPPLKEEGGGLDVCRLIRVDCSDGFGARQVVVTRGEDRSSPWDSCALQGDVVLVVDVDVLKVMFSGDRGNVLHDRKAALWARGDMPDEFGSTQMLWKGKGRNRYGSGDQNRIGGPWCLLGASPWLGVEVVLVQVVGERVQGACLVDLGHHMDHALDRCEENAPMWFCGGVVVLNAEA